MIVGFTGTRFDPGEKAWRQFDRIFGKFVASGAHTFVHGCCLGSDSEAAKRAIDAGLHVIGRPGPDGAWRSSKIYDVMMPEKQHHARNRDIVDQADVMIGMPAAGKIETCLNERKLVPTGGTWWTINYARLKLKPIHIILADGTVRSELMT